MATGNRFVAGVIGVAILGGLAMGFALEWTGRPGAAFVAVATTGLGILCPSPFRQAAHPGGADGGSGGSGDGS